VTPKSILKKLNIDLVESAPKSNKKVIFNDKLDFAQESEGPGRRAYNRRNSTGPNFAQRIAMCVEEASVDESIDIGVLNCGFIEDPDNEISDSILASID